MLMQSRFSRSVIVQCHSWNEITALTEVYSAVMSLSMQTDNIRQADNAVHDNKCAASADAKQGTRKDD